MNKNAKPFKKSLNDEEAGLRGSQYNFHEILDHRMVTNEWSLPWQIYPLLDHFPSKF